MRPASPAQPNVIVVFVDQQRWDTTGIHGNPLDLTPNFDRMAARGTHVSHFFTCQPLCAPARSCLQTGQYATSSGVYRNGIPLDPQRPTLAHWFGKAGYQTGYIGKWHLGRRGEHRVPRMYRGGYQYWLAAHSTEIVSQEYNTILYDNHNREVKLPGYRIDAYTDAAIRYIDAHRRDPFFLFLGHNEPHQQNHLDDYPAPEGYRERYAGRWIPPDLAARPGAAHQQLGGYLGMVKRLDESLGRLLDALRSMGLLENTVVAYFSDHGCHFKTRNAEYKRSPHEASLRVPCALTGPGFDGGGYVAELVSLVDMPPTLLMAAGIPIPGTMQGRPIQPLLRGGSADWPREIIAQISETQVGRVLRTRRWKYSVRAPGIGAGVEDYRYDPLAEPFDPVIEGGQWRGSKKYLEDCLYDLELDPYELTNLIGMESHRELARALGERLKRRMTEIGEPAPVIEPAPPRKSSQRQVRPEEIDL